MRSDVLCIKTGEIEFAREEMRKTAGDVQVDTLIPGASIDGDFATLLLKGSPRMFSNYSQYLSNDDFALLFWAN